MPFDLKGRLSGEGASEESEELRLVRSHTEASLFNKLRQSMFDQGLVTECDWQQIEKSPPHPGDIIEVRGVVSRNALEEFLSIFERLLPYFSMSSGEEVSSGAANSSKPNHGGRGRQGSNTPQNSNQRTNASADGRPENINIALFKWMRDDIRAADLMDVAMLPIEGNAKVVLTISNDFGTGRTFDSLLGSEVRVLGKVTKYVEEGDPLSLLRRSLLGLMPTQQSTALFADLADNDMFKGVLDRLEIETPYVQILPLAIFV